MNSWKCLRCGLRIEVPNERMARSWGWVISRPVAELVSAQPALCPSCATATARAATNGERTQSSSSTLHEQGLPDLDAGRYVAEREIDTLDGQLPPVQ
jgi:hypothetical protein